MQGAEERRQGVWSNTPQGGAIEGNAVDDVLMVDQGDRNLLIFPFSYAYFLPMIQYEVAEDIGTSIKGIIHKLQMTHVDESRLVCIRSKNSNSKRVIARCHGLSRIMQLALNQRPHYIIEVISERFDKLSKEEQIKVLIHELMHIPHSFGGGFRVHKPYVTQKTVESMYRKFVRVEDTPWRAG